MLTNLALDHLYIQGTISPETNSLPGVNPGLPSHGAGLGLLDQTALFAAAAPPSPAPPVQFFQSTITPPQAPSNWNILPWIYAVSTILGYYTEDSLTYEGSPPTPPSTVCRTPQLHRLPLQPQLKKENSQQMLESLTLLQWEPPLMGKAPWAEQAPALGCSWKKPVFFGSWTRWSLRVPSNLRCSVIPTLPTASRKACGAASGQGVTPSWPAAASQLLQRHGLGSSGRSPGRVKLI